MKVLFTEVPRRGQPVEKVGVELMATKNRARNVPEPVCLVDDLGRRRAPRGVFQHAEVFSEVRAEHVRLASCTSRASLEQGGHLL